MTFFSRQFPLPTSNSHAGTNFLCLNQSLMDRSSRVVLGYTRVYHHKIHFVLFPSFKYAFQEVLIVVILVRIWNKDADGNF